MGQCNCFDKNDADEFQHVNTLKGPPIDSAVVYRQTESSVNISRQYARADKTMDMSFSSMGGDHNSITVQTTQKMTKGYHKKHNSKSKSVE